MSTRTDYGQLAAKLDYVALDKKLTQLAEREPPKKRKTAADVLEPLREKLLALHLKGWSSGQLVEELKAAGVPVSPARFRECLSRWTGKGKRAAKSRANRSTKGNGGNDQPTAPASHVVQSKASPAAGQTGFKLRDL